MKLAGNNSAIAHFLMVVEMKNYSQHTLLLYTRSLHMMADCLQSLCGVTELEQVTVLHLASMCPASFNNTCSSRSWSASSEW